MKAILCHHSRLDLLVRQIPFIKKYVTDDILVICSKIDREFMAKSVCKKLNVEFKLYHNDEPPRRSWYRAMNSALQDSIMEDDVVFFEADAIPLAPLPEFGDKGFWCTCYSTRPSPNILMVQQGYKLNIDDAFHVTADKHPDMGVWKINRDREAVHTAEYIEDFAIHLDRSEKQIPPHPKALARLELLDALEKEHNINKSMFSVLVKAVGSSVKTAILRLDRTTPEQFKARIDICRACESSTKTRKGEPYTCGPMLESMVNPDLSTCGCVLRRKARDKSQQCPYGYWAPIEEIE
jgi:hypothetical protein